ncbi:MAG: ABC transporter permease [Sarcina sp.]
MGISLKIAARFLKSNKIQTTLIALGIALGVTVQIFLGLLIKNVNTNMIQTTVGNSSQISVVNAKSSSNTFDNYDAIINNIKKEYPNKVTEITGVLDNPALISMDSINTSVLVRGMNFGEGQNIYNVKKDVTVGTLPTAKNEVAIGEGIAKKFNLKVGDSMTLQTSQGPKNVKVSGILNLNVGQLNDTWVVTDLSYAQSMFNEKNKVNSIEMKVSSNEIFNANVIADGISKNLNKDLKTTNWKAQNASLLGALSGQNSSSLTIQVFIMISVVMSIASVLAISVLQKSKQIGILKAMGIKNSDAAKIFIYQGSILGVIGAIIGGGLGVGVFEIFANFVKTPTGQPIIPGVLDPTFIIVSMIIAFIAATIAAVFAATKSLKLDPMQIIRDN